MINFKGIRKQFEMGYIRMMESQYWGREKTEGNNRSLGGTYINRYEDDG